MRTLPMDDPCLRDKLRTRGIGFLCCDTEGLTGSKPIPLNQRVTKRMSTLYFDAELTHSLARFDVAR